MEHKEIMDKVLELLNEHANDLINVGEFEFAGPIAITGMVFSFNFTDLGNPSEDPEDGEFTQLGRHRVPRAMARGMGQDIVDEYG